MTAEEASRSSRPGVSDTRQTVEPPLAATRPRQETGMITKIDKPAIIAAAGSKPKRIEEYVGRVNTGCTAVSIARMTSAGGWQEPGQRPEFSEYTLVLRGMLRVETVDGTTDIAAGQALIVPAGQWVRYSTPNPEGAEYIAVCLPAFAPETVHRDG
jgi:mannose-6-phosphate isomerase-like protein (cupin superfamily)